ncbi:MAG: HD domain-containing protein [Patescibacteria group bacterium]
MNADRKDELKACQDSLVHLATSDGSARRRHDSASDEDGWLEGFGSPYAADFDKLLCSKAIRRLGRKTQVIAQPRNRHVRDRLSHSFEVMSTAAMIGRILGLNEQLCRSISLGHDIGHTPFGHAGESFLARKTGKNFRHEIFGAVIAQQIERRGGGLNLTWQTLSGIRNHSRGSGELHTAGLAPEDAVVMYADKISYIFADFNDVFTRRLANGQSLLVGDFLGLAEVVAWFGANHRERVQTCVTGLCIESAGAGAVSFSGSETALRFADLKSRMYKVYGRVHADVDEQKILEGVFAALAESAPDYDPAVLLALLNDEDVAWLDGLLHQGVRMTSDILANLSVADIMRHLLNKSIDFTNPDLDW